MTRRPILRGLLATALLLASQLHAAEASTTVGGVRFEARTQLAGQTLALNGAGLRAVSWLKGYAAALYVAQRSSDARRLVEQPGPKKLRIRMLLDVPVEEFIKAFHKGVARNTPPLQQPQLAERMARFDDLMRPIGKVRKGDLVDLDFVPGQGLLFSVNGKLQGPPIPGEDLYGALLLIFVGEHPVDARLKAGLLGNA